MRDICLHSPLFDQNKKAPQAGHLTMSIYFPFKEKSRVRDAVFTFMYADVNNLVNTHFLKAFCLLVKGKREHCYSKESSQEKISLQLLEGILRKVVCV